MSPVEVLSKASKQDIKAYIDTWERINPDEDPLLKRWKQHIDETKKKCIEKQIDYYTFTFDLTRFSYSSSVMMPFSINRSTSVYLDGM